MFLNINSPAVEIPDCTSRRLGGTKFFTAGSDNRYPNEIFKFFNEVSTLRSVVEGSSLLTSSIFKHDGIDFYQVFMSMYLYGQCPLLVRRSVDHKSLFFDVLDFRYVRTDAHGESFAYSTTQGFRNFKVYPAYTPGVDEDASILMIKLNNLADPYALPLWSSSMKEVKMLSSISDYHSASLANSFNPSMMVTVFNVVSDEKKPAFEKEMDGKFGGAKNTGKLMVSWAKDKEHAPIVTPLSSEDVSGRYHDLLNSCNQALFTSFHASPALFGMPDESATALTATEFSWRFSLFIKFTVSPIAKIVFNQLKVFGVVMEDPISLINTMRIVSEGE